MTYKPIDPKYGIRIEPRSGLPAEAFDQAQFHLDELLASARVRIVKSSSGEPIPDDEPLILFRARDCLALPMLEHYMKLALADGCTDFHLAGIDNRIEAFRTFAAEYPERMKQPGVTRGV